MAAETFAAAVDITVDSVVGMMAAGCFLDPAIGIAVVVEGLADMATGATDCAAVVGGCLLAA